MPLRRREFLRKTLLAGGGVLLGANCLRPSQTDGNGGGGRPARAAGTVCHDPTANGTKLEDLAFLGEGDMALHTKVDAAWDARLATDLRTLSADNLLIDNDRFFIRTEYPDQLIAPADWRLAVRGRAAAIDIALSELLPSVRAQGTVLLECAGNSRNRRFGLISAATWSGIAVSDVLDRIQVDASATRVLIAGFDGHSTPSAGRHSTPGASWVFAFDDLADRGAFFATEMNGHPLPADHGAPVRLVVPGWYGCCCIKWVDRIELVDESAPSTPQMREFASRTHQRGVPSLARDFAPAVIDSAAMAVRVETWRVDGSIVYKVVGIAWGDRVVGSALQIRFNDSPWEPVDICPAPSPHRTWSLWQHAWMPTATGRTAIALRIGDKSVRTRRLDAGYYTREVTVDAL